MKKKLWLTLAMLALCAGMFVLSVSAATEGYYTYTVSSNGGARITGVKTSISGDVTIPSTLGGYPVTAIGTAAFPGCTSVTSVTIPDSVTSIGASAFSGCTSLTSVTIPDSVISIGDYAFAWCESLTSVTIPASVTSIGESAFYNCTSLTSVTIPDSVTSIGKSAFYNCTSLTSVTIPDSVTSIGSDAFYSCTSLTSVKIPDSVTSIGTSAFSSCDSLTSVTIPDSVTSIGASAFSGCTSLTSVTIPDSVTSIGASAFSGCTSLTSVTIPDSVTSIGYNTFSWCSSLTSVTIPDSVISIGDYAFAWCDSLTSVEIPASVISIGEKAFYSCDSLTSMTIPDSVTSIGDSAFKDCRSLTSVVIGNSVTSIGERAFEDCSSLTSVEIPDSVISIGDYAFAWCDSLTTVTIPDSVTSIGSSAFRYCDSLTSVTIGNSVTSIGSYAFYSCDSLVSIDVDAGNACYASENGVLFNKDKTILIQYPAKKSGAYTIPDSVISIGDYAFAWCESLTSVTIPASVTSIGDSAFYNCTSLTSVTIGDSVTSIGERAFYDCTSLTSVTIPASVTSIGNQAFDICNSLTSATILTKDATYGMSVFLNTAAGFTIHGYTDSTAETYARINNHKFVDLLHVCEFSDWSITTEPTCTEEGVKTFTCSCGKTYTEAVPSIGHYVNVGSVQTVTAITLENSTSYPYKVSSGKYTSTNKAASSSSTFYIRAQYACTLTIRYGVSSENSYDYLTLSKNGTQLDKISGEVSSKTLSVSLVSGDYVTVVYSKDSSVNRGSDEGYFEIVSGAQVEIGEIERVPAASQNVPCTQAVVCSGCGIVVKAATECSFDNGVITTPATHTTEGVKTKTCANCGDTITEAIPAIGHDFTYSTRVDEAHPHAVYGICECGEKQMTAASSDDATCTTCRPIQQMLASMTLGNELAINFFFYTSELGTATDYTALVTKYNGDGTTTEVEIPYSRWTKNSTKYMKITVNGIAAKEMSDKLVVQVLDGNGKIVSKLFEDSIRAYIMRKLVSWSGDQAVWAVEALNYGAAAQLYFGYNTDDLANADLTDAQRALAPEMIDMPDISKNSTATLVLEESILLKLWFAKTAATNTTGMYAVVSYTDHTGEAVSYTLQQSDLEMRSTYVIVPIDTIVAADGNTAVTVTLYNADGTVYGTMVDSIISYASRKASTNELFEAVARFCTASYNYFH